MFIICLLIENCLPFFFLHHQVKSVVFLSVKIMLPILRSRVSLTRVITQTLAAQRQRDAFRVPTQNSSAVAPLTDEQRAFNLKIWPGTTVFSTVAQLSDFSSRCSRNCSTDANRLLSN